MSTADHLQLSYLILFYFQTWSEKVAQKAIDWGSRCEYVSRPDNNWGQNMNYFYGHSYHKSSLDLFKDTFSAWSNETMHYDYRRYRFCGSKNVCSYVQVSPVILISHLLYLYQLIKAITMLKT